MVVVNNFLVLGLIVSHIVSVCALNNGLALTPPMGWMAWERFRCNVDCKNDPENCISEKLIKEMTDHIESDGFKEAGYEYVCIDDCWSEMRRNRHERLVANMTRFPSGMRKLADYIHSKGLKFGLYADYGTKTCEGYPGSIRHVWRDAITFAEWGVDYLKLDGCYATPLAMDEGYPTFSWALNRTGRPILFSCSWPAYQVYAKMKPDYEIIGKYCNIWRNYGDIQDSWSSLVNIIDWFGDNQNTLIQHSKPGQWNDPDQLIIGNFGLSFEQARAQFAIWAILAAPLMMSNDLRKLDKKFKEILLNTEVIAVNQDSLGRQGRRVFQNKKANIEVWRRYLSDGGVAVVLLSKREDMPVYIEAPFWRIGVRSIRAHVRDLFEKRDLGTYERSFITKVNPSGVVMVKIVECCDSYHSDKNAKNDIAESKPEENITTQQIESKPADNTTTEENPSSPNANRRRSFIQYRDRFFSKP
ncbi:Alpha-N-acetylgalactosaminidase [Exaiptasia diaphana]|nr:Alpha-N-acetylgalactosaminidase [Exaiptasia diaphana]